MRLTQLGHLLSLKYQHKLFSSLPHQPKYAMYITGIIIAICTFIIIGIFHPIVIKCEYHFGTKPWWIFLLVGICTITIALFTKNILLSSILGVTGASSLWSIGELFEQRKRVLRGWFPKNPKRENDYTEKQKH